MNNDTKNKIEELEKTINEAKRQIEELKNPKPVMPEWEDLPERKYFIGRKGVASFKFTNPDEFDTLNYFPNKDLAEEAALHIQWTLHMFKLTKILNEGWEPPLGIGEWGIRLNPFEASVCAPIIGGFYFKDKATALKAFEIIKTWDWAKPLWE